MREDHVEKSRKISCHEAQHMIPGYIEGTLADKDLACFLKHVETCNTCYEELETNYMVDRTVEFLNEEDASGTVDLVPMLQRDLKERKEHLIRKIRMRKIRNVIIAATLILVALLVLDLTGIFRITEAIRILLGMDA